jgi:hypothetical protein
MTELTETLYNKDDELQSQVTTLTAKLLTDLQSPFTGSMPIAILAHYDIEFMKLIKQYGDQRELEALDSLYEYRLNLDDGYSEEFKNAAVVNRIETRIDAIRALTTKKDKE